MTDLIEYLKDEAARNQRLADRSNSERRKRTLRYRAVHMQRAIAEIGHKQDQLESIKQLCHTHFDGSDAESAFRTINAIYQHAVDLAEPRTETTKGKSQGQCETTLTERFFNPDCRCNTYERNLGPCKTFDPGANGMCVYCDHSKTCHRQLLEQDCDHRWRHDVQQLTTKPNTCLLCGTEKISD